MTREKVGAIVEYLRKCFPKSEPVPGENKESNDVQFKVHFSEGDSILTVTMELALNSSIQEIVAHLEKLKVAKLLAENIGKGVLVTQHDASIYDRE